MHDPRLDGRPRGRRALALLAGAAAALVAACAKEPAGVPEEVVRRNVLGTAYLGQLKWAEAEAQFRSALELRPDDPLLLTNAAIASIQQGHVDRGVELLRRAVAADPDYLPAHYNLGLAAHREGDFDRAVEELGKVAAKDPEELFTRYFLASSLARIGREEEALAAYRAALARDPTHVSSLYGLGRLLLQRGEQEEGLRLVTRSQEIRGRSGLDEAVGQEYGEQGPYAMGQDYPGGVLAAPAAIPVRFEDATRVALEGESLIEPVWTLVPIEGVVEPALVVVRGGSLSRLSAAGSLVPLGPQAPHGGVLRAVAAADVDNDARVDLVALLARPGGGSLEPWLLRQAPEGGFSPAPLDVFSREARVDALSGFDGVDLTAVDRDHDGDVDLFWCWTTTESGGGCRIGTNDGTGRFEARDSAAHGFALDSARPGPVSVAFSDVDNDRDVDLLIREPGGVHLLANQRDGSFADVSDRAGLGPSQRGVGPLVVADLDKDGWMDLVVGDEQGLRVLRNRRGGFEPPRRLGPTAGTAAAGAAGLVVFDLDNDGFLDLGASSPRGLLVLHNRGAGEWTARRDLVGDGAAASADTAPLAAFDADADGDLDLAVAGRSGQLVVLRNQGGNANHAIVLDSRGSGDNRFGIGAKVEVLSGSLRQKHEVTRPLPLHVGLADRTQVQAVRYLWPNGVLQDEVALQAGRVEVSQLDRKGTSCPLLYAWRGGEWRFVTDLLGGAALGYQVAPGVFGVPDTDEYVRVETGLDADETGQLRLRLNNQLEEVIWFDQVELVIVDHPSGTEVFPDERLLPGPPFPEFRLHASADIRPIAAARGTESGRDETERLLRLDRRYVDGFARLAPQGYAAPHGIEIDLGRLPPDRRVVLLLDGWIDYADSSANIAAAQAGLRLIPPRLTVADGHGGWRPVSRPMGFPAGLPKTMTVDLTGLFPAADNRLRIETTMRIYWDRARVMVGGERTPLRLTRVAPAAARLEFGGFPREVSPDGQPPYGYDPNDVEPSRSWKAHVGAYTPFGDVTALLESTDDRFVTTRSGDQIVLAFAAPAAPAPGWTRTYLVHADGFGKDMDPNSAAADEVAPIPFHGMPRYPYPPDVAPPSAPEDDAPPKRRVLPSPGGWPGAPWLETAAGDRPARHPR
jgi:tetratricopeptide (TPR) repeat protein